LAQESANAVKPLIAMNNAVSLWRIDKSPK
jgi:hypothetical protein